MNWSVYGTYSGAHVFTNPQARRIDPFTFDPLSIPYAELKTKQGNIGPRLRKALMIHGVDINGNLMALTNAVQTDQDIDDTIEAFREAMVMLVREDDL